MWGEWIDIPPDINMCLLQIALSCLSISLEMFTQIGSPAAITSVLWIVWFFY